MTKSPADKVCAVERTARLARYGPQWTGLAKKAEARWRLVETAWALDLPRAGIAVQADPAQNLLFVERSNWLVDSHHPLRETILLQTGQDVEARAGFLRVRSRSQSTPSCIAGRQPRCMAMTDTAADTIGYYDRWAAEFEAQTADLDLSPLYGRFLRHLPAGGRILDAGCGVGRDALAFAERSYEVVAIDASEQMVALTQARVGSRATVHRMRFEDVTWREAFDGIWTCASLLHVPRAAFPGVAARLAGALRLRGAWYMSFKEGSGERTSGGRCFVDRTEADLREELASVPVELRETWGSEDLRPGRARERWLNAIARRR